MSDRYDALIEAIGGLADRPREPTLFLAYEDSEVAAIADAGEDELTYAVERMAALDVGAGAGQSCRPCASASRSGQARRGPGGRQMSSDPKNSAATPASRSRAGPSPRPGRVR
jgi:hypothetical protein